MGETVPVKNIASEADILNEPEYVVVPENEMEEAWTFDLVPTDTVVPAILT